MAMPVNVSDPKSGNVASVNDEKALNVAGKMQISDSQGNPVEISSGGFSVQPPSSPLFDQHFLGSSLNSSVWTTNLTGAGTAPVSNSFCNLTTTTASGDKAETYSVQTFIHIFSTNLICNLGVRLTTLLVNNNTRIWGMRSSLTEDGFYFLLKNGILYGAIEYDGIITAIDINGHKPSDGNLHRYRIVYSNYRVEFIINDRIIHIEDSTGKTPIPLINQEEMSAYFSNENTALATSACQLNVEGVALFDTSVNKVNIFGKDDNGLIRTVAVSTTGRLLVSQEPAAAPPTTTAVNEGGIYTPLKNAGTSDEVYTITNGKTLFLQNFNGGSEAATAKFELYYDPNGTGVGMTLIQVAYLGNNNFAYDLNIDYEGDGTAAIRMRATNNTPTNGLEFAMFLVGYEQDS